MFPLRLILAGIPAAPFSLSSRRSDDTTMFAARVRASLKPLFHGIHSSSFGRNCCEIAATSRRVLLDRFNDGTSLRLSGNKIFHGPFHSSPQCYSSGTDVGVKTRTPAVLFSSLEDDFFSELGSVEKDRNGNMVVQLLTKMPEDEKPKLSQNTKGRKKKKKKKKKKKHEQASDSISKPKLLTEKPEVSRVFKKTNGERKTEAHASSPARNVTDPYVSFSKPSKSSSPIPDHESKAQNITSPSSEANYKTRSNSHANHPSLTVVLRIGNLNSKTTDSMIHSRCLSIGSLQGLARVNEDNAEVLFRARNMNEANSILEKLNGATVDHSQWMAEIVPEAEEVSQDQMRMSSCIEDLEKQLMKRRILVKDLEVLVHSVIHLENHPMAREGTKASGCSQEA